MQQANTAQQQLDSSVGAAAPSLPSFLNIHLHSRYWLTVLTVLTDCPPPRRSGRGGGGGGGGGRWVGGWGRQYLQYL
jgi:hypothetical protein